MNVKKIAPLAVALILGLAAARMVVKIIEQKNVAQVTNGPKLTQVVIAQRDVASGEALSSEDLSAGQVVAESAPANSFTEPADLNGRVTIAPLVKGQTILESLLAPKGSGTGLQAAIPPGMRAVTIDINEVSGVAGYINAGSRVDIIQTVHSTENSAALSRCLAQNVQVTAVGMRGPTGQDPAQAHSVTLLVTPRQAELIELSSATGRPRLVLRNDQDHLIPDLSAVTLNDLTGEPLIPHDASTPKWPGDPFAATTQPSALATAPPSNDWRVRVIAGGQPSTVNIHLPAISAPNTADAAVDTKEVTNP